MNENEEFEEINSNILQQLPDNISMITKVWGPPTWFFLHSMAMSYPKKIDENNSLHRKKRNAMFSFLHNLGDVLPCPLCSDSYSTYIRDPNLSINDHLSSRARLIHLIYKIHNRVNEKLGVPKCNIPSFKEVVEFYNKFTAGPCKATSDEERQQRLLLGCKNDDINNNKFKNYSCSINIIDNNNKNNISINSENFQNNFESQSNSKSNKNTILIIIITILIIILAMIAINFLNKN